MMKSMGYMHDILGVLISFSLHVLNIQLYVKNALLTFNQFIFVSSGGTKVEKMLTLAPERYTAGFYMVAKVIL